MKVMKIRMEKFLKKAVRNNTVETLAGRLGGYRTGVEGVVSFLCVCSLANQRHRLPPPLSGLAL